MSLFRRIIHPNLVIVACFLAAVVFAVYHVSAQTAPATPAPVNTPQVVQVSTNPSGSCTMQGNLQAPSFITINSATGVITRCVGGTYVSDPVTLTSSLATFSQPVTATLGINQSTVTTPYSAFSTLSIPNNLVLPASTTDTIAEYWSQIFIPTNVTLTGACLLNAATVTTDKHIVFLANAAGTIVANSALAGVADSGANSYQCQNFTATFAATGPQTYFVGTQPNGTTDNFFTYTTGGAPTNYGTGLTAAGVFGTLVAIAPTSTFSTAKGPLMFVY